MRLTRTPRVNELLTRVATDQPFSSSDVGAQWVEHAFLISLAKQCGRELRDVLAGSGVYFAPPQPKEPPSREYEALMTRLRAEAQEREYRSLIADEKNSTMTTGLSSSEIKEVKEQLTTILNIMVSIVAIAWAFWHWTASWDLGARTLISLFAGIGIGVAECVVYLGYKRRVAEARMHEPSSHEKRSVVKKVIFNKGVETVSTYERSSVKESEAENPSVRFRRLKA